MPPQDGGSVGNTNLGTEGGKERLRERLGKDIRQLSMSGDMRDLDGTSGNHITNKVIVKCKMFHAGMMNRISTSIRSTEVVT